LFRDRDGGLWIGTRDHGLLHVHQGRSDVFSLPDGLSGYVHAVHEKLCITYVKKEAGFGNKGSPSISSWRRSTAQENGKSGGNARRFSAYRRGAGRMGFTRW